MAAAPRAVSDTRPVVALPQAQSSSVLVQAGQSAWENGAPMSPTHATRCDALLRFATKEAAALQPPAPPPTLYHTRCPAGRELISATCCVQLRPASCVNGVALPRAERTSAAGADPHCTTLLSSPAEPIVLQATRIESCATP